MSIPAKAEAVLALNRFGMGPRPGSISAIASDPRGALLAELDRPPALPAAASALPSSGQALRIVADFNARRQAKIMAAKRAQEKEKAKQQEVAAASTMAPTAMTEIAKADAEATAKAADTTPNPRRQIYLHEAKVRMEAALSAEIGFTERLVWFWSNHFCISADSIRRGFSEFMYRSYGGPRTEAAGPCSRSARRSTRSTTSRSRC